MPRNLIPEMTVIPRPWCSSDRWRAVVTSYAHTDHFTSGNQHDHLNQRTCHCL